MATAVWTDGAADGDWSDSNNWTGGSGAGGAPANNDTVVINTSSRDITTGLTTGLTGITLRIGPNYTGSIGTSSTWLDIDGPLFELDGAGTDLYSTGIWTTVHVKGGLPGANMLNFRANASTDIGTLRCTGGLGTVTVGGNAVLDVLEIAAAPQLQVIVSDNVTSFDNLTMDSGAVTFSPNLAGTAKVRGGTVTFQDSGTIAALDVMDEGVVLHKSSGTITTLTMWDGFFDGRENTNSSVTVTNAIGYGGELNLQNALRNYTLTNGLIVRGPIRFFPALGSTLTVS